MRPFLFVQRSGKPMITAGPMKLFRSWFNRTPVLAAASDVPVLGCTPGRSDRGDQAAAKHSTSDAVSGSNIQTWSMWTHMIVVDPARRSDARLFHCLDAHHTPSHVHVHVHAHVHVVHHARSRTREARLGAE